MNILKKIVKYKKKEIKIKKEKLPLNEMLKLILKAPANRNFKEVFEYNDFAIIGEIKKKSPSTGTIKAHINLKKIVKSYESAGIKAISIVTDKKYFDGNEAYIEEAKKFTGLPILRKDFIIDEYQIYESRLLKADAILIIASIVDGKELCNLVKKAKFLNMTPVVEIHSKEDIKKAIRSGTDIIGINARDLKTFKTDFGIVKRLVKLIPKEKIIICESGIKQPEDIKEILIEQRIKGVLIGTMFMKAGENKVKNYVEEIMKMAME